MKTDWNEEQLVQEYANRDRAITDWRLGYSKVLELLGDVGGKRVLDYGCGSGKFSRRLAERGACVYAVDTSEWAIREALRRPTMGINYELIESGNLTNIPSLDAAVINLVLCCVEKNGDITKILSSIREKLAIGDPLIICEPHPEGVGCDYVSYSSGAQGKLKSGAKIKVKLERLTKEFHDYWRPKQEYIDLIENSGFLIERINEPLAPQDELFWKDEKIQAPYLIVKAIKSEKD